MLTTRTLNPLPFEHLEPHRFEDLVRQLVYDFRVWRTLEATGRSGSDQGADIRGIAIARHDEEGNEVAVGGPDQIWVIQCKREKSIGPKQLARYAADVLKQNVNVHGLLFVASADFSIKARDTFRAEALAGGVEEAHLWGRSEIEDRLLRPENDHLLFAYFGVSLNVRRRSARADLSRRILTKRKLLEFAPLRGSGLRPVLLRDPSDNRYPFIADVATFKKDPPWMYYETEGHYPVDHISFNVCWRDGWVIGIRANGTYRASAHPTVTPTVYMTGKTWQNLSGRR